MARDQMGRELLGVAFRFDFRRLRSELGGHDAHALGAREIEASPCGAQAVFGLAAKEFGNRHDFLATSRRLPPVYMSNAKMR